MTYRKVKFSSSKGSTAGIIVDSDHYPKSGDVVGKLSRLFPVSECMKMKRLHVSPEFATFEEAFAFEFGGRLCPNRLP